MTYAETQAAITDELAGLAEAAKTADDAVTLARAERDAATVLLGAARDALADTEASLASAVAELADCREQLPDPDPEPEPEPEPKPPAFQLGSSLHRETGETLQTAFNRREATWGNVEPMTLRVFDEALPWEMWPQIGDDDGLAGTADKPRPVIVSCKAPPAEVAAGRHDDAIRAAFRSCPTDGLVHRWAFWHEIEDNIEDGNFTRAQYRAAEARVRGLAIEVATPEMKLRRGWIGMGWTWLSGSGRNPDDFMPETLPDFIGVDVYPGPTAADIKNRLTLVKNWCLDRGITEYWVTEWGLHQPYLYDGQQTADFLPRFVDIAIELGFRGAQYFDSTVGGDFRLDKQVERDAMGALIRRIDPKQ